MNIIKTIGFLCIAAAATPACKSNSDKRTDPAPPHVPTTVLQESVKIRAQKNNNVIWIQMDNSSGWLGDKQSYDILYGTKSVTCDKHPGKFQGRADLSEINHRIVSEISFEDASKVYLCIKSQDKLVHKQAINLSTTNSFAPIENAPAIVNYARRCAEEISYVPTMNCLDGEIVPITVNGKEPENYPVGLKCDRPAMLDFVNLADSQCVPYSRIQKVSLKDPDTVGAMFCRRYKYREKDDKLFDDINIIIHRKSTGATCFFQIPENIGKPLDGRRVPPPHELPDETPSGEIDVTEFWLPPEKTAARHCIRCHDSDPFVHSPYINQTKQVPSNPNGLYTIVGKEFADVPQIFGIDTTDENICTSCHRIGHRYSCNDFFEYSVGNIPSKDTLMDFYKFPHSHWMPAQGAENLSKWESLYGRDVERLRSCCENSEQDFCRSFKITKNLGF